jgi:hypothetical protein
MYTFEVSPALLLALVAGGLALAFDYLPGLAAWFDGLLDWQKRLWNAGLVTGFAIVIFAGQCAGIFITNLVCDLKGALDLLYMVFLAITINQGVHMALKPSPGLKARIFGK